MRRLIVSLLCLSGPLFPAGAGAQTADVATEERTTTVFEGERPEPPKSADLQKTAELIVEKSNAFREQEGRS